MISIGGIIGAGLFVSSSTSIIAGGPASFISYAITGLLILLVMRMLGEMATALPNVRSFTEFARAGLGDGAGFVVGWLYWYFWVLVVPVEAIAGAKILQHWIPCFSPLQIGLGLMTVMTGVNLMSARSYAEFEFWFASIKVAAILVFIVIAASYAFGWTSPHGADLRQSRRLRRLHAARLDRRARRGPDGVLRHDRRGDHHHCRGGIGATRPRRRQNEHAR